MATNKINGHKYIGQTIRSLKQRKQTHIAEAISNRDSMYFHRALKKYQPENFTWEVLKECNTIEELNMYEADYIGLFNTYNNGYNSTYGGHCTGVSGWHQPEEARQKISSSMEGNQHAKGYKHTDKDRLMIAEASKGNQSAKGYKHTEKTKLILVKANKNKVLSTKTKQRISENSTIIKPVIINNRRFRSLVEAAKFMGVTYSTITRRIKKQIEGYRFV